MHHTTQRLIALKRDLKEAYILIRSVNEKLEMVGDLHAAQRCKSIASLILAEISYIDTLINPS